MLLLMRRKLGALESDFRLTRQYDWSYRLNMHPLSPWVFSHCTQGSSTLRDQSSLEIAVL